jgi:hypothetical protein
MNASQQRRCQLRLLQQLLVLLPDAGHQAPDFQVLLAVLLLLKQLLQQIQAC